MLALIKVQNEFYNLRIQNCQIKIKPSLYPICIHQYYANMYCRLKYNYYITLAYHLMFPIILSVQLIALNAKCYFNIWAKKFPCFNVLTGTKLMKPNAERLFQ